MEEKGGRKERANYKVSFVVWTYLFHWEEASPSLISVWFSPNSQATSPLTIALQGISNCLLLKSSNIHQIVFTICGRCKYLLLKPYMSQDWDIWRNIFSWMPRNEDHRDKSSWLSHLSKKFIWWVPRREPFQWQTRDYGTTPTPREVHQGSSLSIFRKQLQEALFFWDHVWLNLLG